MSKKVDKAGVNSVLIRRPIQRFGWLFLLPTFAAFCIGFVWPFIQGIYLSFCNFVTVQFGKWMGFEYYANVFKESGFQEMFKELTSMFVVEDVEWVGIGNYAKVFADAGFFNAFKNTTAFAVVTIVLINVIAFAVAYALTQKMRGSNLFRTVFFMPNLIGGVVLGYIWSLIFDGILKHYSTYLTANPTYGFWGLVILVCWQQIGYMMIIYIAGLQSVSEDMLEAARIDGASGAQTLFKVIIPNVMPSITTCTFLTLTNGFKLFDQNLALTGGSPSVFMDGAKVNMTELLALNIYSTYNISNKYHGVAQAKAVIFFLLVAVLAIAQQYATRSKEVQQ